MKTSLTMPLLMALAALLLAGCAQNPVTGRQNFVMMSEADEIELGRKSDADVRQEYGMYDLPALQQYVDRVGQRLAAKSHRPQLGYRFTVVDSPEINAFALPGGYIYITRGLMAYLNSEAELAAVIGHEIGHVTARHSVQQYSAGMAANIGITLGAILVPELRSPGAQDLFNTLGSALLSGYGREHELEADRLGAQYLARAGYDPQAMVRVIGVLKNQELFDAEVAKQEGRAPRRYHGLFASHPDNDTRLQQVVGEANQLAQPDAEEGRAAYLAQMNGVIFGDSPEQGLVRGHAFYHEGLGFTLEFPDDWSIRNRPDALLAQSQSGDGALELHAAALPDMRPAEFLRTALKPDPGSRIEAVSINGLPGAIATAAKQGRPLKVGVAYLKNRAYVLLGSAKTSAVFDRYQGAMETAMLSFRAVSDADRKLFKPHSIRTVAAAKGARFAELARHSPLGKNAEGYLRLMNNAYPEGEPQAGQILKIVTNS